MTDTHHYPKDDLATPSKRLSFLDNDGDTDALSLFPNSPSRFSNKYSDDRYRSLVQESPPAGFNVNTPTTDERRDSRSITPRSKNSNHTEEFRTVQEWDEVMRHRRSEAKVATAVSSPKKPKQHDYQRQLPERKPLQEPVRDLSVRERSSYRELPIRDSVAGERVRDRYEASRENVRERRDDAIHEPVRPSIREPSHTPIREPARTPISDTVSTSSSKHLEKRFEPDSPVIESKPMPRSTESPTVKTTTPPQQQQQQQRQSTPDTIPSYMRSTMSYESRIMSSRSQLTQQSMPFFRSSTRINAMEDIRSEMDDQDIYVPLAVRVKLFEQGLGNNRYSASGSRFKTSRKELSSRSRLTRPRSPNLRTSYRTTTSSISDKRSMERTKETTPKPANTEATKTRATNSNSTRSSQSQSNYLNVARDTISSRSRQSRYTSEHASQSSTQESETASKPKRQKTHHSKLEVKPFRFATDERALHHQKAFKAKLELWKKKEMEQSNSQEHGIRGTKRKVRDA